MRPRRPLTPEQHDTARRLLQTAKTKAEFQRAQCIWLRTALDLDSTTIATAVGWQPSTVKRLQSQFIRGGEEALQGPGRGGRRRQNLTPEEEDALLKTFVSRAQEGHVLIATDLKTAYEAAVGRVVPKSTVYRMLARHGWRKIAPRPRHPQGQPEQREVFKKTPGVGRGGRGSR